MNLSTRRASIKKLVFLAGVVLLAVALLMWPRGPKEPVYQGKAITQWINEANDVGIFEQTDEMNAAMAAFGTNALPFLLDEFTSSIAPWRDRLSRWISDRLSFAVPLRREEERVSRAGRGLILLGTNAAPAMPLLARYLNDPRRDGFVVDVFAGQGEAALPFLIPEMAATNAVGASNVWHLLQRIGRHSVRARVFADDLRRTLDRGPEPGRKIQGRARP